MVRVRWVVLHHMLPQEHRIPLPLIVVVVHREVENLPVGAVVPVLGAVGGEHRVLRRKDKGPAGGQPPENILHQRPEIPDIVEGQGAEHHVKAARREVQVLHGGAAVLDGRGAVFDSGRLQHLLRQVGPQDIGRPVPGGVAAVPAVAAAQVQHVLRGLGLHHTLEAEPAAQQGVQIGGEGAVIPLFWFFGAGRGFPQFDKVLSFTVFSQRKRNSSSHMGPPLRHFSQSPKAARPGGRALRPSTSHTCSAKPGAEVEPHQPPFLQPQGPAAR